MDSRTIVLKGWKITEEDYYKLIDINTDYADYAYCPCWGDTDGELFSLVIKSVRQTKDIIWKWMILIN